MVAFVMCGILGYAKGEDVGKAAMSSTSAAVPSQSSCIAALINAEKSDPLQITFRMPPQEERVLDPFPRRFLVGRWQSIHQTDDIVLWTKGKGAEIKRKVVSFESICTYDFREDGTYTMDQTIDGKASSAQGRWMYKDGILSVFINVGNKGRYTRRAYRIDWFSEDEMAQRWRNEKFASNYWNDFVNKNEIFRNEQAWAKIGFDKYGCEIHELFHEGDDGAQYEKAILSPGHYHRISAAIKPLSTASYKMLKCERIAGSDFAYDFKLELTIKGAHDLAKFHALQQEFRAAIKNEYLKTFPHADRHSVYVDFPSYKLVDGKIEGRAIVLSMTVVNINYDPGTRKGMMSMKISSGQFAEARKYIRKNIETLARDKNIALTTGEIPPAAKFYLGREELKAGNIFEIEFKTE